jgi:hypothetical protein
MNELKENQIKTSEVETATGNNPTPFYIYYGKDKNNKQIYGNHFNTSYPYKIDINNENDLLKSALFDHTTIEFAEGYNKSDAEKKNLIPFHRENETFIKSKCLYADVDNDKTENESDWITPEKFINEFKEYEFYLIASRNHNKIKIANNVEHKPRPKFHIYFPLQEEITSGERFMECQKILINYYPYLDKSLCDCGRFLYGNITNTENSFVKYNSGKSIIGLLNKIENRTTDKTDSINTRKKKKIPTTKG